AVLDAGSGEGYGAALLAEVAARVVGIDRAEAVRVAAARHRAPGLEFRAHDLERLGALGERFDLVVSFQVIEHVRDPVGFLRLLGWDPLGLRRRVPAAIARRAFPPLARLVRRRLALGDRGAGVGAADFTIGPDHLDTALDLVVVSGEIA